MKEARKPRTPQRAMPQAEVTACGIATDAANAAPTRSETKRPSTGGNLISAGASEKGIRPRCGRREAALVVRAGDVSLEQREIHAVVSVATPSAHEQRSSCMRGGSTPAAARARRGCVGGALLIGLLSSCAQ